MIRAVIKGIEYHLPEGRLTNSDLATQFPEWSVEKIEQKTGIAERRIVAPDECSSDLAIAAAKKLFATGACTPAEIDFVLLCTQSPDYFLPTTACIIQDRLVFLLRPELWILTWDVRGTSTDWDFPRG